MTFSIHSRQIVTILRRHLWKFFILYPLFTACDEAPTPAATKKKTEVQEAPSTNPSAADQSGYDVVPSEFNDLFTSIPDNPGSQATFIDKYIKLNTGTGKTTPATCTLTELTQWGMTQIRASDLADGKPAEITFKILARCSNLLISSSDINVESSGSASCNYDQAHARNGLAGDSGSCTVTGLQNAKTLSGGERIKVSIKACLEKVAPSSSQENTGGEADPDEASGECATLTGETGIKDVAGIKSDCETMCAQLVTQALESNKTANTVDFAAALGTVLGQTVGYNKTTEVIDTTKDISKELIICQGQPWGTQGNDSYRCLNSAVNVTCPQYEQMLTQCKK